MQPKRGMGNYHCYQHLGPRVLYVNCGQISESGKKKSQYKSGKTDTRCVLRQLSRGIYLPGPGNHLTPGQVNVHKDPLDAQGKWLSDNISGGIIF